MSSPNPWPLYGLSAIGGIGAGLTAAAGTDTTGNSTTNSTQTTTPNLSPLQTQLMNQLLGGAGNLTQTIPNLNSWTTAQEGSNNVQSGLQQHLIDQTLAARGLSYSPTAALAGQQNQLGNFQANTQIQDQAPLLTQELTNQNLGTAAGILSASPHGSTTTGNQTQQMQQNTSAPVSGAIGAGISSAASGIGGTLGLLGLLGIL